MNLPGKKVAGRVGHRGNGRGQKANNGRTRVLIVDDSQRFRQELASLLAKERGVEVVGMARDGLEAVEMAARLKPDIVLMDQQMPGLTGIEATVRIRENRLPAQIFFVAGDPAYRIYAMRAGADQYFLKGTQVNELLQTLRAAAGETAPGRGRPAARAVAEAGTQSGQWGVVIATSLLLLALLAGLWKVPRAVLPTVGLVLGLLFFLYALKYYAAVGLILFASASNGNGNGNGHNGNGKGRNGHRNGNGRGLANGNGHRNGRGLNGHTNGNGLKPVLARRPFVSIHLPMYNEKDVVDRLLAACTSLDYTDYEVIVADDSTDETTEILRQRWGSHPRVKISHRLDRKGFKGGALQEALKQTDARAEYIVVFDADFIPPPGILDQFLAYFYGTNGHNGGEGANGHNGGEGANGHGGGNGDGDGQVVLLDERVAVVQGYQWHVLNASENWITRAIRSEYSGSYVVERGTQELVGALKMVSGSVFMIRADVLRQLGWRTSITEDWELTLRLYLEGFKVLYTPFVQAPAECVSGLRQLIRQRMRWAEGHTYNVKRYFWRVMSSQQLTWREKLEFLYYAPYYLQAAFFMLGTTAWLLSELVFRQHLPFWSDMLGWSLVFTNVFSLGLMNLSGLFLERGVRRGWLGLLSFLLLTYLLVPYQAYAALKGLLEPHEGGWDRTQKTGVITEVIERLGHVRRLSPLKPRKKRRSIDLGKRLGLPTASITRHLPQPLRQFLGRTGPGFRFASSLATGLLLLGILASQVPIVSAAPDAFYLRDTTTNGASPAGQDMNLVQGSSENTLTFDSADDEAYWYTDVTYPTGSDDASLAGGDYTAHLYFDALPNASSWWNTAYDYRQNVTLTAGSAAVPSGYTVSITFNHAALVSAGKSQADGDDIRLTYWNGSGWTELDRFLDPGSSWNSATTRLWFKTQAAISASGSSNAYDLYYGNPSAASPPANPNSVFFRYDGFESGDLSAWDGSYAETGDSISASTDVAFTGSRSGKGQVNTTAPAQAMVWWNLASQTTLYARVHIYLPPSFSTSDHVTVMEFLYNWTNVLSVTINDDMTLYLWNAVAGEAYGYLTTTPITRGVWHTLDMMATISPTVGEARLWLDGNLEIEATGKNLGSNPINRFATVFYWASPQTEANTVYLDDAQLRAWVNPEPTTSLGSEAREPSVDITVSVYHTAADGSGPQEIITSATTTITSATSDPLDLSLGSGLQQTFTQADPRRLRMRITVASVNSGGSFTLAYDSAANHSSLDTPVVTVPEWGLVFLALVPLVPMLTSLLWRRRRLAMRLISLGLACSIALGLLSTNVPLAGADPDTFYLHDTFAGTGIAHQQTLTTAQTTLSSYSLPSVAGGTNQLYLVSVAIYGAGITVSSISGGGLTWTLQVRQCSARITQPRVEIWQAFGSPSSFAATVNLSVAPSRSSAAISRYSGANTTTPTEAAAGSNTNGLNGACSGGTDNATASLSLTSSQIYSVLYVATHPRTRTITTADVDYTQRAFISNSDVPSGVGGNLYIHDRTLATAGTDSADHVLSSTADWDMAGLVIRPASSITPPGRYMNTTLGTAGSTMTFNAAGQDAYWYTDITYPTGAGNGGIAAGAYTLNMYFNELPRPWWNASYAYRQRITVTAGSAAIPSGYSVPLTFNHASLVTAVKSLASGNDVRVVYWNGSAWVELDRSLDELSSWNNASTKIWFRTQTAIGASSSDGNYYLYYGNSGAVSPPANKANIFDLWDDFLAGSDPPTNWTEWSDDSDSTVQTVTSTVSGSIVTIDSGGSLVGGIKHNTYTTGNTYGFVARVRSQAVSVVTDDHAPVCWFINAPTGQTYCYQTRGSAARNRYVVKLDSTQPDGSDTIIQEDTTTGPFPVADTYYVYEVQRLTNGTMRTLRNGSAQFPPGGGWSTADTNITSGAFGLGGESAAGQDYQFDWVWARKLVDPEPTAAATGEATSANVQITVRVHHTNTTGGGATLITSASTTITSATTDPLLLSLGSGALQTFTAADPRLLRVQIEVTAVNGGERFVLDYDGTCGSGKCSNLDTPVVVVPENAVGLVAAGLLIPGVMAGVWRKRRLARRRRG